MSREGQRFGYRLQVTPIIKILDTMIKILIYFGIYSFAFLFMALVLGGGLSMIISTIVFSVSAYYLYKQVVDNQEGGY